MENKSSVNTKQEPIVRGSWTKLSRRLLESDLIKVYVWPPELNLIPIKADPNYLDRPNWFRRSDLNSSRTKFKRKKMVISVKLLACKIR